MLEMNQKFLFLLGIRCFYFSSFCIVLISCLHIFNAQELHLCPRLNTIIRMNHLPCKHNCGSKASAAASRTLPVTFEIMEHKHFIIPFKLKAIMRLGSINSARNFEPHSSDSYTIHTNRKTCRKVNKDSFSLWTIHL